MYVCVVHIFRIIHMLGVCNMCIVFNSSVRVRKVFIVTLIREVLLFLRVSQVAHEY